jgi:hypothetical protein
MLRMIMICASLLFAGLAQAADYDGTCSQSIMGEKALIAPPMMAKSIARVSPQTSVLVFEGAPGLGESLVPLRQEYESKLLEILAMYPNPSIWVGIVENMDGKGQPGLWMRVWVGILGGCFVTLTGDRVYEARGNAPTILWNAVSQWEAVHPQSRLIRVE